MAMNVYDENRILSATPVELVRILYAAAVREVDSAREHLRGGNIAGRSREITKAQMILLELAGSIDRGQGAEIAGRLVALYDYMLGRLTEANIQQEDRPLAEVSRLLMTLQEGWSQRPMVEEGELAIAGR